LFIQSISNFNLATAKGMKIRMTYKDNFTIILNFVPEFAKVPDFVDLEFELTFTKLIEYNDANGNDVYDDGDDWISDVPLNNFKAVKPTYGNSTNSDGVMMHNFTVETGDGVFAAHTYIADGLNQSSVVITPDQMKFDFEINYPFTGGFSNPKLALETSLKTPTGASGKAGALSKQDTTIDEANGYGANEQMIQGTSEDRGGYFSYVQHAVNGSDDEIEVFGGDLIQDGSRYKFYLNYPNASFIYHDPKVGVFSLEEDKDDDGDRDLWKEQAIPGYDVLFLLIGTAIGSIGVIYLMRKRINKI
ncbi:MAG: hypothetical protein ACTSPS_13225, partial [Promethearchaeota archaeon]